ncbi:MAG: TonB-dependent receptor [Veillonellaceae bacterium]|nr:TonB-dependent receptor [Veillonellaceae bacterium]
MSRKLWLAAVVAAVLGSTAQAADYSLAEVVVTAARVPQTLRETPTTVEVVNQETLVAQGATNLAEALETVPGITFHNDGMRRSHVTIRGTDSRHTLILVDGKRVGTDVGKTLYNPNILQDIGMENIERVEIVKGGASALYGSEAIGGVINVITKAPDKAVLTLHGQTGNYQGGEHNEYRYHMSYDTGKTGNWRIRVAHGARKQVPQYNKAGGTDYYYGLARPTSVSIGYSFDERHELVADYERQVSQQYGDKYVMGADVSNRVVTNNGGLTFRGTDGGWEYTAQVYRNQYVKDYAQTTAGRIGSLDYTKHTETVFDLLGTRTLNAAHRLTLGGEYRKENGISTRMKSGRDEGLYGTYKKHVMQPIFDADHNIIGMKPVMEEITLPNGQVIKQPKMKTVEVRKYGADLSYWSVYAQDEWRPNEKWLLVPAIRYDHSNEFGGRILPKFGATYFNAETSRWKFNIGTGFVTPGLMERYYDFDMAGIVHWVGNPDLKPEKSVSYELAWEKEFASHRTKLAYFYNDIRDYWNAVPAKPGNPASRDQMYVNEYRVISQGLEWTGSVELNEHWGLNYGYTYLHVKNKDTNRAITEQPKHKIDLGLRYSNGAWSVNIWGNRYGGYLTTDGLKKSTTMLNMTVAHRWENGLRVFLGVDNILKRDTLVRTYNGRFYKIGFDWRM